MPLKKQNPSFRNLLKLNQSKISKIPEKTFFGELPDGLFITIVIDYSLHDVPNLILITHSVLKRIKDLSVLQRYLAAKFRFPALIKLPLDSYLFFLKESLSYGEISLPHAILRSIGQKFVPTIQFVEELTLLVLDHYCTSSSSLEINVGSYSYEGYIFNLLLLKRDLNCCVKCHSMLGLNYLNFEDHPNIESLLSKWFRKEEIVFKRFFFGSSQGDEQPTTSKILCF